jgi:flagellar hook protein FlgE
MRFIVKVDSKKTGRIDLSKFMVSHVKPNNKPICMKQHLKETMTSYGFHDIRISKKGVVYATYENGIRLTCIIKVEQNGAWL